MIPPRTRLFWSQTAFFAGLLIVLLAGTAGMIHEEQVDGESMGCLYQTQEYCISEQPVVAYAANKEAGLAPPPSEAERACGAGIDPNWWGKVQSEIERSEYDIRWQEGVGAYQSPNRAQNLRFTYSGDGFVAEPRTCERESPPWKLIMTLRAWGREDKRSMFQAGELRIDSNRAIAEGSGVTVTYENDREGMQQDFLVRERPPGSGPLRLLVDLALHGVVMEVPTDGGEVTFVRAVSGGARVMSYGHLKVCDAEGRLLEARMVKEADELFAVVVDDRGATYPILVDPLSTSPDWTAESNQAGAYFGFSVATAGDVNGDGYSDVIVGAMFYDNGQTDEGRAHVYHGGPTGLASSPDWTAESNQSDARFGCSVATAGSINGDDYSDVIVGAYWYDNGQTNEGRAYVYHGSSSGLSAAPAWTAESDQASANFGRSVAPAGDVNSDGYSDVIVGAFYYQNGQTGEGRAYVYHGSSSGLGAAPAWTAESDQAHAYFGFSVATAGDVNADGYSDVIVGAYAYDYAETNEGRAFVYHGGPAGLNTLPDWTTESGQANASFGYSVATAGDVNGDGYSDVIVGAYRHDNGQTDEGRAFVYHGSSTGLEPSPAWTAESDQAGAYFGFSVAMAGDANGDGYSDIIVGAYNYDNEETNEGRAFVFHGSASGLASSPNWTAESDQNEAWFGCSVATAGDINGDGYSDVIVGAYGYDNPETDEGLVYAYHGGPSGLSVSPAWAVEGNLPYDYFSWSVATAGDVNGDGFSDVIVGAPLYGSEQTNEGRAYVYHGSPSGLPTSPAWTAESNRSYSYFGISVATAGDVNGDGYADVIVGAHWYRNWETSEGGAFVYHGGPSGLSATPAWMADSNQDSAYFGISVASAGDVNGDGYSDVIIGAYGYNNPETDEGRAYVYHGSPSGLDASPFWTAESDQADSWFGWSVATAGDVNGDGYSDVIVGASQYDNPEINEGRAYVYHGGPTGLAAAPAWTTESDQAVAWFGFSVATAGDVNGDGYSDVIVGAYGYDNPDMTHGQAFVYHGSTSGLSASPTWIAESDTAWAWFGRSVATAGDVNGDGFSDVIVGDPGSLGKGRTYSYHGGPAGLNTSPAWIGEGELSQAMFGQSVATAGDVNGDGYSDVIVGAPEYYNPQLLEGAAYVYNGNDGDGLHMLPRQWRTDLITPVVPALKTRSESQVALGLLARTFFGRGDREVQFEVKPLGTPFDGTGLVTTGWLDPGITVATAYEVIGGLSEGTMYRWRTRTGYRMSDGAPQPYGRWIYQPYGGGLGEADFQVSDSDLPPNVPELHIFRLSPNGCRLWWYTVPGATSYDLYRGTFAYFAAGSPWQTVAAPDTSYDFGGGVGNPATNFSFLCRAVGVWGESGNSNRVGEFDFDAPIPTASSEDVEQETD